MKQVSTITHYLLANRKHIIKLELTTANETEVTCENCLAQLKTKSSV